MNSDDRAERDLEPARNRDRALSSPRHFRVIVVRTGNCESVIAEDNYELN